jgi:hypothetical protein
MKLGPSALELPRIIAICGETVEHSESKHGILGSVAEQVLQLAGDVGSRSQEQFLDSDYLVF